MNSTRSENNEIVARRAELLAELFLQELKPEFVARSSADLGYDFLVGFRNPRDGINNVAVEVKSTEQPAGKQYPISRRLYDRWAYSNIPVLLLIIDVKENRYYYTWASPEVSSSAGDSKTLRVELTEITDSTKAELLEKLRSQWAAVSC
jgi:Domain of unknown function (DUF4365)